ncbi:hypothetical protein FKW77_002692 [Venturia effusa]|uniref:Uncharacterized protein n=1 Tax=Venturia effusa TaxID=50376 RepID=A0A517LL24_9PEZI|nr:hypothetical protein FKW77_002692 [Venturia effusa]
MADQTTFPQPQRNQMARANTSPAPKQLTTSSQDLHQNPALAAPSGLLRNGGVSDYSFIHNNPLPSISHEDPLSYASNFVPLPQPPSTSRPRTFYQYGDPEATNDMPNEAVYETGGPKTAFNNPPAGSYVPGNAFDVPKNHRYSPYFSPAASHVPRISYIAPSTVYQPLNTQSNETFASEVPFTAANIAQRTFDLPAGNLVLDVSNTAPNTLQPSYSNHASGGLYVSSNGSHQSHKLQPAMKYSSRKASNTSQQSSSGHVPRGPHMAQTSLPIQSPLAMSTTPTQPFAEIQKFMKNLEEHKKFYLTNFAANSHGPTTEANGVLFYFQQNSIYSEELAYRSDAGSRVTLSRADVMALDASSHGTTTYAWNLSTCIAHKDRPMYYGSFKFFGLPLEVRRMVFKYLIKPATVHIPNAKVLGDAYDWDTMAQAPDAKEPRRGPSGQAHADVMECSKEMCLTTRELFYKKRTYILSYLSSVVEFKLSIGDRAFVEIRHLVLPLRRFETTAHAEHLVGLQALKTLVLICDKEEKTETPFLRDEASFVLYHSQEPFSRVVRGGISPLSPDSMINDFAREMHRHIPNATLSITLKFRLFHEDLNVDPRNVYITSQVSNAKYAVTPVLDATGSVQLRANYLSQELGMIINKWTRAS